MNKLLLICTLFLGILTVSCKKFIPLTVEKINDNQVAPLNAELPQPLKIRVLNHKNEAIEGVKVRFFIKNGSGIFSGNVYEAFDTTDAEGYAECRFKLGIEVEPQMVEAEIKKYDGDPIIFSASPEYLTDSRDGQEYLLSKIGDQIWTAQNIRHQSTGSRTNPDYPSELYGRLYNWYDVQNACPSGCRLPNLVEYQTMTSTVGNEYFTIGKKLKSRLGWLHNEEGKNLVGFDLYPAGNFINSVGQYRGMGEYAAMWTATDNGNLDAVYAILTYDSPNMYYYYLSKSTPCSCRCIKNQ